MNADHFDDQIIAAIRDEAYSAPLDLDRVQLQERLGRDAGRWPWASLSRIAAVLLVGLVAAGAIYATTPRPGPTAAPGGGDQPPVTAGPPGSSSVESSAPRPTPTTIGTTSGLPLCDDVPYIEAAAEYYRDAPIYVGNPPDNEVREWAVRKPGFQALWIDREHNGWLTLAFTSDASERQHEIAAELPGVGAVAVQVDWTMRELEALQRRVREELEPELWFGSGIPVNKGVVNVHIGALTAERIATVESRLGGERICLEGADPADVPPEGPQPQSGDGWRLLADADGVGPAYRTGIAYDTESYAELWRITQLAAEPPAVDFESEVAVWFGVVTGSICPPIRMDDVVVDRTQAVVYPAIVYVGFGGCTDDIHPHAYVVALERSRLPNGAFAIDLDPERAVREERTIVEVDLSRPGATAGPGEVHADNSEPEPRYVEPGDIIEPGYPATYRQSSHCGLEWLGPLNDVSWRTPEAEGSDWIPVAWKPAIENELVTLRILMTADPPQLRATANGHSVTYEATPEDAPGCD